MQAPIGAIVVAAGASRRTGSLGSKIWWEVGGRPVWRHAMEPFLSGMVDRGVVVARAEEVERCRRLLEADPRAARWEVVAGGAERADSVEAGLSHLQHGGWPGASIVLIHDAARPLVPPEVVARVLGAARNEGAAVPVLRVVDTVRTWAADRRHLDATVDREGLALVQTPQGARLDWWLEAYAAWHRRRAAEDAPPTDDAELLCRLGRPVVGVEGDPRAKKLTTPEDMRWLAWQQADQ